MNWETALAWIAAIKSNQYLDYSNWRLPDIAAPFGFSLNCTSFDGSTDPGYSIQNRNNELAARHSLALAT